MKNFAKPRSLKTKDVILWLDVVIELDNKGRIIKMTDTKSNELAVYEYDENDNEIYHEDQNGIIIDSRPT